MMFNLQLMGPASYSTCVCTWDLLYMFFDDHLLLFLAKLDYSSKNIYILHSVSHNSILNLSLVENSIMGNFLVLL